MWDPRVFGHSESGERCALKPEGACQDMAAEDKAAHKATEIKGKVKEGVGRATDDEELQAEGQVDQAEGNLKQAGDKVKDVFKK
jgi:uncharacterized protein YjbJ (UPF0337 family)